MLLAGDVGGTKTRLALIEAESERFARVETYASREYPDLAAMVRAFAGADLARVTRASFCVAGPVVDGAAALVNLDWTVDGARLARDLALETVLLMNDLEAMAYGVPSLPASALAPLNAGAGPRPGNAAVIAAGTGLGEAYLVRSGACQVALATEGGHADFAPRTDEEIALLRFLIGRYGRVSYERILSGPGLLNVYDFLRETGGGRAADAPALGEPAAVSRAALESGEPVAREALRLFASVYGAEAGNMALRGMSLGGVYVAGGVAPRVAPALLGGTFVTAYGDKGRLSPLVRSIPVYLVRDADLALRGAARQALAVSREVRDGT